MKYYDHINFLSKIYSSCMHISSLGILPTFNQTELINVKKIYLPIVVKIINHSLVNIHLPNI